MVDVSEAVEFAENRVAEEADEFGGDVPKHLHNILAGHTNELVQDIQAFELAEVNDNVDDPTEEMQAEKVAQRGVDIVLAAFALGHEYDIDMAERIEDRLDLIEDVQAFREELEAADSDGERLDIIDAADDEMLEELGVPTDDAAPTIGGGVEAGTNVDNEEYDPDERDRHIQ